MTRLGLWALNGGRLRVIIAGSVIFAVLVAGGLDLYASREKARHDTNQVVEALNSQAKASATAQRLASDRVETLRLTVEALTADLRRSGAYNAALAGQIGSLGALPVPEFRTPPSATRIEPRPSSAFSPTVGPVPQQPSPNQPPALCSIVDLLRLCERMQ